MDDAVVMWDASCLFSEDNTALLGLLNCDFLQQLGCFPSVSGFIAFCALTSV